MKLCVTCPGLIIFKAPLHLMTMFLYVSDALCRPDLPLIVHMLTCPRDDREARFVVLTAAVLVLDILKIMFTRKRDA